MQLLLGGDGIVEQLLVEPPRLGSEPTDAVPVNGAAKFLFGYGKAHLYRRCLCIGPWQGVVYEPYGKNRKRFPGEEKRMNMLLSLEPLIYPESITNGKKDLKYYLRRLSSDTVSL